MRISRLETHGVKCLTEPLDFSPVQVITGPIGSGKTSILSAIQLGAVGEVANPDAPTKPTKRNLDIFRLATQGSEVMNLTLAFDDERKISREWEQKDTKDGPSVSGRLSFTGQSADSMKSLNMAERELREWLRPSIYGINVRLFPAMTAGNRRKLILDMLAGAEQPDDRPLAEWLYIEAEASNGIDARHKETLAKLTDALVEASDEDSPVIDRLRAIEEAAKETAKTSRDEESGIDKAIAQLSAGEAEAVDTSRIPVLEQEVTELNAQIEGLNHALGAGETIESRIEGLQAGIDEAVVHEDRLDVRCQGIWLGGEWSGCEHGGSGGSDAIKDCQNCLGTGHAREGYIADTIATVEKVASEKLAEHSKLVGEIANFDRAIKALGGASQAKLKIAFSYRETAETLAEKDSIKCPMCVEVSCPLDPDKMRQMLNAAADAEQAIAKEKGEGAASDGKKRDKMDEEARGIQMEVFKLKQLLPQMKQNRALARRRQEAENLRIGYEKELTELEAPDLTQIRTELDGARSTRQDTQEGLSELAGAAKQAEYASKLTVDKQRLACAILCADTLARTAGPRGIQGKILRERVGPLVKTVDEVLQAFNPAMGFWLDLVDARGNESCSFGYSQGDLRIPFETASGGEQMLICIAVAIAMMRQDTQATIKILLLDEMQSLNAPVPMAKDRYRPLQELIGAMAAAVRRGWVDNVILAGLADPAPLKKDICAAGNEQDMEEIIGWTELSVV